MATELHNLVYAFHVFQGTSAAAEKPVVATFEAREEAKPFAGRSFKKTTTKTTTTSKTPEISRTHQTQLHQTSTPMALAHPPPVTRIMEARIPPTFTKFISHCRSPEGTTARFDVTVIGTPTPEIWWYRNGEELHDSPTVRIAVRPDGTSTLIFPRVKPGDHGKITCKAENAAGLASCTAKLIVEGKLTTIDFYRFCFLLFVFINCITKISLA